MNNPYLETQAINWLTEQCSIESTLIPPRFLGDGKEVNNPTWHGYNIESSNKKLRDKYGYAFDWHNENFLTVTFKTFIGDFKIKEDFRSNEPVKKLSKKEVKAAKEAAEQAREISKANDAKIAQRALEGIKKDFFDRFTPDPQPHPYLEKKSVNCGERFRFDQGKIYIPIFHSMPMMDGKNELISYQSIDGNGEKLFPKNGRTAGGFYPIGIDVAITPSILYIAEGYATAYTIHVATGSPVIVAFSASNILPVSTKLRELYPHTPLVICGDDDRWKKSNAGRTVATKVLSEVSNTHAVFPSFDGLNVASLPTDFNDLFTIIKTQFDTQTAFEEVASQLEAVTNSLPKIPTIAQYATRYLPKIPFEKFDTTILHSGMGTGKSHGLREWVMQNIDNNEFFIASSPRISLTDSVIRQFREEVGVELADYRKFTAADLGDNDKHINKLAIVCNSLHKLAPTLKNPSLLSKTTFFIDEVEQQLRQLATMEDMEENFNVFKGIVAGAGRVIMADANADKDSLSMKFIKELRGDRSMLIVENTFQCGIRKEATATEAAVRTTVTYSDRQDSFFAFAINELKSGKRVLVATDSKDVTEAFDAQAREVCKGKVLVINSDTSHSPEQISFMANPNAVINDYQMVAYSPAIASGVSIDEEGFKPFDLYCGFFSSMSGPNPQDAWQQMGRVRAPVDWHVFVNGRIEHEETDPEKILKERSFKVFRECENLTPDKRTEILNRISNIVSNEESLDLEDILKDVLVTDYVRLQVAVQANEARLKNNFAKTHRDMAIAQGYEVVESEEVATKADKKVYRDAKRLAGDTHVEKVCTAPDLTAAEYNRIEKNQSRRGKTIDEVFACEKYELRQFYGSDVVIDEELVIRDNNGELRRAVRRLDMLANPQDAQDKAGEEIIALLGRKKSIFHFKNYLLFVEIYLKVMVFAGFDFDDSGVLRHDGRALTSATLGDFIRWVEGNRREVNVFHKVPKKDILHKMPMSFLQEFLDDIGIRLKGKVVKKDGELSREYLANSDGLEKLNLLLKKQAVSRMDSA